MFSRTHSRILGALSKLGEFVLIPEIRTHSGTVPGTFRNTNLENQGTNEDDSQSDPHPEAGIFRSQTTQNSGPKVGHDMVTGVQEEIRYRPHLVTVNLEDISYCSLGSFSGKQKKARSTSHPHSRSENTTATIEADQTLSAHQQLSSNCNSANIINNINKFSKLPKSLTTTMFNFDGKSEKLELFENLFHTSSKEKSQSTHRP